MLLTRWLTSRQASASFLYSQGPPCPGNVAAHSDYNDTAPLPISCQSKQSHKPWLQCNLIHAGPQFEALLSDDSRLSNWLLRLSQNKHLTLSQQLLVFPIRAFSFLSCGSVQNFSYRCFLNNTALQIFSLTFTPVLGVTDNQNMI